MKAIKIVLCCKQPEMVYSTGCTFFIHINAVRVESEDTVSPASWDCV